MNGPRYTFRNPFSGLSTWTGASLIILVTSALYLVALIFQALPSTFYQGRDLISGLFALDAEPEPWLLGRMLTYGFVHENFLHLLFNMVVLAFAARPLESRLGRRNFILFYLAAVYFCGLFTVVHAHLLTWNRAVVVGASGAISALLFIFWRFNPDAQVLLFFIIPMPIRYLMIGLIAIDAAGTIFPLRTGLAHSTHLAGYLFGWLYLRYSYRLEVWWEGLKFKQAAKVEIRRFERKMEHREKYEVEIDPILKKISEQGMGSLSDIEREILKRAGKGPKPQP